MSYKMSWMGPAVVFQWFGSQNGRLSRMCLVNAQWACWNHQWNIRVDSDWLNWAEFREIPRTDRLLGHFLYLGKYSAGLSQWSQNLLHLSRRSTDRFVAGATDPLRYLFSGPRSIHRLQRISRPETGSDLSLFPIPATGWGDWEIPGRIHPPAPSRSRLHRNPSPHPTRSPAITGCCYRALPQSPNTGGFVAEHGSAHQRSIEY